MQTTRITNNLSMMPIITMEDAHLIAPKTKKTMTPLHFPKQHLDKDKDKKRDSSWSSTSKSRRPKNPVISHEKTKKTKLSTWLLSWPKTIPRSRQNSIDDTDISSSSIVSTDPLLEGASTVDNNRNITTTASSFTTELGRLPHDLLVHMLSFAGPRVVTNLAQTSRHFQEELTRENEAVWNILGVAYGKWKYCSQEKPTLSSWKALYFSRPLVPVDYPSIPKALHAMQNHRLTRESGTMNVKILLQDGKHYVNESINIDSESDASIAIAALADASAIHKAPQIIARFNQNMCNQPLVRFKQGNLTLKGLDLIHASEGADLWNGNAAVDVSASSGSKEVTRSTAMVTIQDCSIRSASGRGVSVRGQACVTIRNSCIHNCAATGVYIAGQDARLSIRQSDIVRNGQGTHVYAGVRRGHSGLYLEAGTVTLRQSSIAHNTATGISVVAAGKNVLRISDSDILANERVALDGLSNAWNAGRQSVVQSHNNRIALSGTPILRSTVLQNAPKLLQMPNLGMSRQIT